MTTKKCCKKCLHKVHFRTCECHQPKPEVEIAEYASGKVTANGVEISLPSPASTEEWEKVETMARTLWRNQEYESEIEAEEALKNFIRSHDQQLRQRIVEAVKEAETKALMLVCDECYAGNAECRGCGGTGRPSNAAVSEIIADAIHLITNLK